MLPYKSLIFSDNSTSTFSGHMGYPPCANSIIIAPDEFTRYEACIKGVAIIEQIDAEPEEKNDSEYYPRAFDGTPMQQTNGKILYTTGIADCIGIAVWGPETSWMYHATKYELRSDMQHLFINNFLEVLKRNIDDANKVKLYVASSMFSEDLITVFGLLDSYGFHVSGVSVPNIVKNPNIAHGFNYCIKDYNDPSLEGKIVGDDYIASTSLYLNTVDGKVFAYHASNKPKMVPSINFAM